MNGLNKVIVAGQIEAPGPKLTYAAAGTPECRFTLRLDESGKDGQTFKLFLPILIYSTHAEWVAEHVSAGDLVLIDGKLRYHSWLDKAGVKQSRLAIMAWAVSHLTPAPAVSPN
jgi:single stranded DNA-binding protein